jgi:hypothetical protein
MSDYAAAHRDAVTAASVQVEKAIEALQRVEHEAMVARTMITNAVGEDPRVESAANALSAMTRVHAAAGDLIHQCGVVLAELERFGGGF